MLGLFVVAALSLWLVEVQGWLPSKGCDPDKNRGAKERLTPGPCDRAGGWNQVIFKVLSSPNQSVSLCLFFQGCAMGRGIWEYWGGKCHCVLTAEIS